MCGITGIYDFTNQSRVDQQVIEAMTAALVHRGPDDCGYHVDQNLGFGFRRLSIIDLATGNQPMFNEDRSLVSVCNGEIYNYGELAADLKSRGHRFYTTCDVEVLVHLYEEYGLDFIKKLNGQFAFAIFDRKRQTLLLVRDQAGIAPLFYTVRDGSLIFASEIKAILKHPQVSRQVDLTGLDQVFSFPGLVSPRTMFKGISSLKPGHYVLVAGGQVKVAEYWDLTYPEESETEYRTSEAEYVEQLDELLRQSVKYRLIADVPVGFYLSGGLDSSLIAALIHNLYPGETRHSFSIGFNERE
ncbi:MAG: asparagine synthase (glutamine-hydrolyzing), partial [Deltaproteobacteria bacterium]|nr:asparagine synthase (glutamine-hydrolyzing) [Deltaproteobacteria bacterium]